MVRPASPSRPAQRDSARLEIVHERDEHGSVYAVEIVEAARWDAALLRPPDPEAADARIVRLQAGLPDGALPRWLVVEQAAAPGEPDAQSAQGEQPRARSIAKAPAIYEVP